MTRGCTPRRAASGTGAHLGLGSWQPNGIATGATSIPRSPCGIATGDPSRPRGIAPGGGSTGTGASLSCWCWRQLSLVCCSEVSAAWQLSLVVAGWVWVAWRCRWSWVAALPCCWSSHGGAWILEPALALHPVACWVVPVLLAPTAGTLPVDGRREWVSAGCWIPAVPGRVGPDLGLAGLASVASAPRGDVPPDLAFRGFGAYCREGQNFL